MHGYRAVHVIVFSDGSPIEIQVRTEWQHEWAEFFEKLADLVGRGIRYGEPPSKWWTPDDMRLSEVRKYFELEYKLREFIVGEALIVADLINSVEVGDIVGPDDPDLPMWRRRVEEALRELRESLLSIDDVDAVVKDVQP